MQTQSPNINDSFFEGIYKDVWRKLIPPGLSEAECDFIEDVAGLEKSDKILDLMCGYGRHTLELAKRGYDITAIDNSESYVSEINFAATQKNLSAKAFAVGALEANLQEKYKAILCMGNSFAFFSRGEAIQLLKKLSSCLEPGGIIIINSWMIAEIAIKHFQERECFLSNLF